MEKCNICLKKHTWTASILDYDKHNVNWFTKLQNIIPELEWLEEYQICQSCTKQLEAAWEFKKFVLSLNESRCELRKNEVFIEDDFKGICDTEYICTDKNVDCEQCLKTFTTNTQLHQHKLQIHGEQPAQNWNMQNLFTCFNCNVALDTKDKLIHHIENEHRECDITSCNKSESEQFYKTSKGYTASDNETVDNENNLEVNCSRNEIFESHFSICSKQHPDDDKKLINLPVRTKNEESKTEVMEYNSHNFSRNLQENLETPLVKKRRGRKPMRTFNCEICNEEFAYVKLLTDHCASAHGMDIKIVKPYSCELCDMRFACSANLEQHQSYHIKNRTHICSLCGKGFMTKSDLTVHEYTHYNRRNYKCALCDKAFNTNKNLRTHNLVVHTDHSLWKYACSICEKRFPLKTNYDQHLRRHTGEKEHACHICKKPFISKSELQRHVHMHSNIRAFKCSDCEKEYKERRTYLAHLAKKHGIGNAKITVREKKFVCHICPSQFYDKQKLTRHICSHSGVKPFGCYVCDKKFTDKSYLKHHLKTSHNIVEQS